MKTKEKRIDKVIKELDKLKRDYPNTEIIIDVPNNVNRFKIGDANIMEGMGRVLYFDAE